MDGVIAVTVELINNQWVFNSYGNNAYLNAEPKPSFQDLERVAIEMLSWALAPG